MSVTPTWFGPEARPLFGWLHVPDGGRARGAVVLCPPIARELAATHGTYQFLAEALADAGLLAIRFDYDGTGDSSGALTDPGRVAAWLESIEAAVALARASFSGPVSLLGMRVGALLAAVAAARVGSIDALVLWDPVPGRAFLRSEGALRRLNFEDAVVDNGGIELPGFVLDRATVTDLGALGVSAGGRRPSRTLFLTRPRQRPLAELAEALDSSAEQAEAQGQELLLEVDPSRRQVPTATISRIVEWLAAAVPDTAAPVTLRSRTTATLPSPDGDLIERVVWLGPHRMFGISAEPEHLSSAPTVLMLNAGAEWHVGPNRLWVELSRQWAAAGFRCVRFDETGLGDTPPRPGLEAQVVRAPEAMDDVGDAAEALEPDPTNVVLLGLCSGGYQALENALLRPVRAVYAINPGLHFTPPEMTYGPMDARRRICWPVPGLAITYRWSLLTRAGRRLREAIRTLWIASLRRRLIGGFWVLRHLFNADSSRTASSWLDELRAEGVEVLVVCGEDEARPFGDAARGSTVGDTIRVEVVPGLDHALTSAVGRDEVVHRLTEHLVGHFARPRQLL